LNRHFPGDSTGDYEDICLAWRWPEDFPAVSGNVETGGEGAQELEDTAGRTGGVHVDRVKAAPVKDGVGGNHGGVTPRVFIEPLVGVGQRETTPLDQGINLLAFA